MSKRSTHLKVYFMLTMGVVIYFFANLQRVAIPGSIFDELQHDLNAGAKYITALGSMFMYVYAAGQLVVGLLDDRYGGERVITFGALLFCLGSVLFPFCTALPMLYFSRLLVGMGASAIYLSLVKILAFRFPKNFPVLLGFFLLWGYAGGIVGTAPLVYMVKALSWRTAMAVIAGATVASYLLFLLSRHAVRLPPVTHAPFSFRIFGELLKKRHNRSIFLYSACSFGTYYCIHTVIGKKFLEDFCKMSVTGAAWTMTVFGVLASVSAFCMALISRWCGNRRKIFLVISGGVALFSYGFILLSLLCDWRNNPFIPVLLCAVAWFANQGTIVVPTMKDTNTPETMGTVVSLSNGIAYLAVALLGNATGLLLDFFVPERVGNTLVYTNNSYLAVFGLFFLLSFGTLISACRLRDTRGKNVASTTP
ncbi:MAG: MFS transporter [Lentisphaeria bacterium]|nr:MFS transporter [Lentisphaeria bacterium]